MRKYHKRQVLDLVASLGEAHKQLNTLARKRQDEAFIGLLADCQDSAVFIGEFVEAWAGEKGAAAVAGLEHYCDLLFAASQAEPREWAGHVKNLERHRRAIGTAIWQDLPAEELEVLFMPYKASMWDSMESIWQAACADPNCTPVVMPVPYYDMLPSGQKGQMHYDGPLFPAEAGIVAYSEYPIAQRRPDVIIVHNPYDGTNLITRLPEEYYCERIKAYTDLLVYVPYFVSNGSDMQEHFVFSPGVRHADIVVAVSQAQRQSYIRQFKRMERMHSHLGRVGDIEKKCVALGSPKYDKVLATKREDCRVPEAWRALIERPDGSRRKVVLYNTTITDLLKGNDTLIKKLCYVFDHFQSRDDVVLWWRPHPLNAAACQAMRPHLYSAYTRIVEMYVAGGWGIYDDTPDLHRALAMGDAYYGDASSLIPLFRATGKPVILQRPDIVGDGAQADGLTPNCVHDDGEYVWLSEYHYNALYRVKKGTWQVEYMGSFPGEPLSGIALFSAVAAYGDRLIFVPTCASGLAEYDKATGMFTQIKLDVPQEALEAAGVVNLRFYGCAIYDKWLYCTPLNSTYFVKYDLEEKRAELLVPDWALSPKTGPLALSGDYALFARPCVVENSIYLASCKTAEVVEFDMPSQTVRVHPVRNRENGFSALAYDNQSFYLISVGNDRSLVWRKGETPREFDLALPSLGFSAQGVITVSMAHVPDAGELWFFPQKANKAFKLNLATKKAAFIDAVNASLTNVLLPPDYIVSSVFGTTLYASCLKRSGLDVIDLETGRFTHVDLSSPNTVDMLRQSPRNNGSIADKTWLLIPETIFTSLGDILDLLVRGGGPRFDARALRELQITRFNQQIAHADGTSGQAIYDLCKECFNREMDA